MFVCVPRSHAFIMQAAGLALFVALVTGLSVFCNKGILVNTAELAGHRK